MVELIHTLAKGVIAVILLALIGICALAAISWAGRSEVNFRCLGTATQTYETGKVSYPNSRLGLKVEQSSWFVFWDNEKKRVSYKLIIVDPDSGYFQRSKLFIPLWEVNSTFFSTEATNPKLPQVYHENATGYVSMFHDDGILPEGFDGFCEQVTLPF